MSTSRIVINNLLAFSLLVLLTAIQYYVSDPTPEQVQTRFRIGINPWPGYAALLLAEEKGFFDAVDIPVELVEISSLADIRRAFERNRINIMTGTLAEVVEAAERTGRNVEFPLILDYSDGGDVLLAKPGIQSVADLRGKRLGVELGSLGVYVAQRALETHALSFSDVTLVPMEQIHSGEMLEEGRLDAIVSYPPFSEEVQRKGSMNQVFSSSDIPGEVIDVLSMDAEFYVKHEKEVDQLIAVWDRAVRYCREYPEDAMVIMARRTGLTVDEFKRGYAGVTLMTSDEVKAVATLDSLTAAVERVKQIFFPEKSDDKTRSAEQYIGAKIKEQLTP